MAKWFYAPRGGNGEQIGPVRTRDLQELARTGTLHPDDLIWKEGMEKWVPARKTKGLFPEPSPCTPPPLPESHIEDATVGSSHVPVDSKASVGSGFKAAALLAAKKAQRTGIAQVSLPAAYHDLGKALHGRAQYRDEFDGLYKSVDTLLAKLDALKSTTAEKPATTLTGKAKALGIKAKDVANAKTLDVQVAAAFRELGEAAYQKHGGELASEDSGKVIAKLLAEIHSLDEQAEHLSDSVRQARLLENPYVIGVSTVFFFPVGLILLWRYSTFSKRTKWIVTACVAAVVIAGASSGDISGPVTGVGDRGGSEAENWIYKSKSGKDYFTVAFEDGKYVSSTTGHASSDIVSDPDFSTQMFGTGQLKVGMSMSEVENILGKPSDRKRLEVAPAHSKTNVAADESPASSSPQMSQSEDEDANPKTYSVSKGWFKGSLAVELLPPASGQIELSGLHLSGDAHLYFKVKMLRVGRWSWSSFDADNTNLSGSLLQFPNGVREGQTFKSDIYLGLDDVGKTVRVEIR